MPITNILDANFTFTWPGKVAAEVFYQPSVDAPEFTSLFKVIPDVKNKMRLKTVNALSKFVRAYSACTMTVTGTTSMSDRTLQLCELYFHVTECEDAFAGTVIEEDMPTGLDKFELGSEVTGIIQTIITSGLQRDLFRIFTFGDTGDADADWNQCDGLVTKLIEGIAAYDVVRADDITTLNQTSGTRALDYLRNAFTEADNVLKQMQPSQKVIHVTGNLYENLLVTLEDKSLDNMVDKTMLMMDNGVLYFRGIEVQYHYAWDQALEDATNPYYGTFNTMLLYTARENNVVGIGKLADQGAIKQYFSEEDDLVHWKGRPNMGYNYVFGGLTVFSYGQVS